MYVGYTNVKVKALAWRLVKGPLSNDIRNIFWVLLFNLISSNLYLKVNTLARGFVKGPLSNDRRNIFWVLLFNLISSNLYLKVKVLARNNFFKFR